MLVYFDSVVFGSAVVVVVFTYRHSRDVIRKKVVNVCGDFFCCVVIVYSKCGGSFGDVGVVMVGRSIVA